MTKRVSKVIGRVGGVTVLKDEATHELSVIPQCGRYAIAVPYMVDQNEPSKPCEDLVFVPDCPKTRKQVLLDHAKTILIQEDDPDPEDYPGLENPTIEREEDYGDLSVTFDGGETFVLYTFVNLPEIPSLAELCSDQSSSS